MTKKHYRAFAEIFRVHFLRIHDSKDPAVLLLLHSMLSEVVGDLCIELERENPKFDVERFLAACKIPPRPK